MNSRLALHLVAVAFAAAVSCLHAASTPQERADDFLALTNASYQALSRVQNEAQWLARTDVTPAHDAASEVADKAYNAFVGNPALIKTARALLADRAKLNELTWRQLDRALLLAAEGPM